MDRFNDAQQPSRQAKTQSEKKSAPSGAKAGYLILYNSVSALLWSVVLGRTVLILTLHGYQAVYLGTGQFTKWTQTLAALEVLHAAIGTLKRLQIHLRRPQS